MALKHAVPFETLSWTGGTDGFLTLIDQTRLPTETAMISCRDVESVIEAIRSLRVRGAPAIGIAAAYGVVLGMQGAEWDSSAKFVERMDEVCRMLAASRPTAVNLFWAIERMKPVVPASAVLDPQQARQWLLDEAVAIHEDDRRVCRAIGAVGAPLIGNGAGVLTHCNAGGLATADYGTALAVLFSAHEQGKRPQVYVDETRPLLQGARLTAWELKQRGIETVLICDSMAAQVMREGRVRLVITGADRIAANGDTANKIGTYGLAVLARAHGIPFYIAAPTSTFDLSLKTGAQIPIEVRGPEEITHGFGRLTAPVGVRVYNPAFDVTPADLIQAIICEKGLIAPVSEDSIRRILQQTTLAPPV
jgi:methylthioribose-1-phosphate isomerase